VSRKRAPADATPEQRKAYAVNRRLTKPDVARWRVKHGVCDQDGDVITATLQCQRDRCGAWYSVQRSPATVKGSWPRFCSQDCREGHQAIGRRRSSRKVRHGETSGAKKPVHSTFRPDTMPIYEAAELAETIVKGPGRFGRFDRWATGKVYEAAASYLDEYDRETDELNRPDPPDDDADWY
jgi:hypothetical protein